MHIVDPPDPNGTCNETIQVRLGGVSLTVPLYQNEEDTQRLAKEINDRLKEIESKATRVDSQAFALRLAYSYALEIELLKKKVRVDQREIEKALDELLNRFKAIVRNQPVSPDAEPPATPPVIHRFKPRTS